MGMVCSTGGATVAFFDYLFVSSCCLNLQYLQRKWAHDVAFFIHMLEALPAKSAQHQNLPAKSAYASLGGARNDAHVKYVGQDFVDLLINIICLQRQNIAAANVQLYDLDGCKAVHKGFIRADECKP